MDTTVFHSPTFHTASFRLEYVFLNFCIWETKISYIRSVSMHPIWLFQSVVYDALDKVQVQVSSQSLGEPLNVQTTGSFSVRCKTKTRPTNQCAFGSTPWIRKRFLVTWVSNSRPHNREPSAVTDSPRRSLFTWINAKHVFDFPIHLVGGQNLVSLVI